MAWDRQKVAGMLFDDINQSLKFHRGPGLSAVEQKV